MKELVTGGAGFIGSHLVERLLSDNNEVVSIEQDSSRRSKTIREGKHEVIVVDDFSIGKKANLLKNPRLKVYRASILDDDINDLFRGVDTVYHLAALTRPQWSIQHPEETDTVNVHGTLKILEHCRDNHVKRVVFMSSSSIYGETDKVPTPEDIIPRPMCPYAASKLIGEVYCQLFERIYGLEFNAIRPFNVYGSRQDPVGEYAAAVPRFIDRVNSFASVLKADGHPVITGDGNQARDFVYVEDVVDLMVRAARSKVHGEAFNAGSGKNISINYLYDSVCRVIGTDVKAVHIDPVLEPKVTLADISKARRVLGWKPRTDLETGLRLTIKGTK